MAIAFHYDAVVMGGTVCGSQVWQLNALILCNADALPCRKRSSGPLRSFLEGLPPDAVWRNQSASLRGQALLFRVQALKILGPLRIPDLAENFVVMDADLRWVRPMAFFQFNAAGAAFPTMVWSDRVHVSVRTSMPHMHLHSVSGR